MFTEEATEDFSDPFRRLGNYEGDPVYNITGPANVPGTAYLLIEYVHSAVT
ncbi:hypothetical protein HY501_02065 [Candidatus Woesearchaeota archaeon]|nr:hypothetical protein [Candidatus Woesearchaeota archaeon]